MKIISAILNLPWTVICLMAGLLSLPERIVFVKGVLVLSVKSFWWYSWLPNAKGVRAMAMGNVILLGPNILDKDLEHELVHIKQYQREPFIHPILYAIELIRFGYRNNKYEKEAYEKAGNIYIEK